MSLDLFPAFFMAVLACWLGLSLLVRSPRDRAAQTFAWLCLHLALYGLTIALGGLTASADVRRGLHRLELVETALLPPAFFHFMLVVSNVTRFRQAQHLALAVFYLTGVALAGYAAFAPAMILDLGSPRFPDGPLVLLSLLHRALPLLLAVGLAVLAFQQAQGDPLERRRRAFFLAAAIIAVSGALLASVAREAGFAQAPGHALMDTGLAMMAYMVLAYRMLLPARVAQRTFYRSLLGGVFTAAYVGAVVVLEPLIRAWLAIDAPLVTIFAIVILVAIFGPFRDGVGAWLDRRFFHREFDYGRLLRAVSEDLFERGDLRGQLEAGLSAICRTLGVRAGAVAVQEGTGLRVLAAYGVDRPVETAFREVTPPAQAQTLADDWEPWPAARLLLPLQRGEQTLGLLTLGSKRSGAAFEEVERVLLDSLGRYLALAIIHARRQQEEELALAALTEQSRQLQAEQELLAAQAAEAQRRAIERESAPVTAPQSGMRVYALGPLRVERNGETIERWGGSKAGTYQAEALFAFLFDRRGHGVTKDEAEEVIWPDLDLKALDKADTAFHRTLSGLRRTLEPGLRRGNESRLITYHHERYWLDPAAIDWCDTDAFSAAVERAHTLSRQGDTEGAITSFREALDLYRNDYMFDCPFFGDSAYVEERREALRDQYIGALLALGARYEQLGQVGEAATCYRRAIAASPDECPRAEDGLARLQVGTA